MKYGYARVSSKEQNLDRQLMQFSGHSINAIYSDKQSGKDFERPEYKKLCKRLQKGDVLFVSSLDRLGRNYDEIQEQWRILTKDKQVDIVVLDMPLLDTRADERNLTSRFIADLVLQILAYVAQMEREAIRKRQAEGIAAAHERGVKFGRPRKSLPANFDAVVERWKAGEITGSEAAKILGMPLSTFRGYVENFMKTDEYKARVKEGRAKNIAAGRQKKKETASKKVFSKDEFVKRIMMSRRG
ncbi:MAG: recombinase family protein [Phascolarctobacterium sp.]|nr:recombinase family protein [Phascolarctobacterium sp.]